jgi:hypothetical protein
MAKNNEPPNGSSPGEHHRSAAPTKSRKIESIQTIREMYRGNWVLVTITEFNEMHFPVRGRVLALSPDHFQVNEALRKVKQTRQVSREKNYHVFFAEPLLTSGPQFEESVSKAVDDLRHAMAEKRASRNR